ncbi:MAG: gliding motility-associated C-terminal domain-containing protein, partial [Bacteroidales bacterium]|nr:gliding motility-associated C-terminal domain-containing protein [Bacteroidales bacterium]
VDTLHLTINHAVNNAFTVDTCDWYTWNGTTYDTSGTYTFSFADVNGCTQVDTLHLTLHYSADTVLYVSVLENNLPYHLNDSVYQVDGTYMQYLQTRAGCDSTITLHLTVLNNVGTHLDSTVCADALPLTWNDSVFTAAGTKLIYLVAANGADSIVAMTLTVNALSYTNLYATVVENDLPYHYLDSSYYASGEYTYILTNAVGCDSVVTLDLTVYGNVANEVDSVICESELPFTWNDSVFTASGSQVAVLTAATGADSVLTMNVTVIPTTYGTLDTTVVENDLPVTINDSLYRGEGSYTQYLTNVAGCDSVLTVVVDVHYNVTTDDNDTICESQLPIMWNGVEFDTAGVQNAVLPAHTGADSTVVMHLMVIPTTYATVDTAIVQNALPLVYNDSLYSGEGTFVQSLTNAAGCDSILTLHLTVYPNVTAEVDSAVCEGDFPFTWNDSVFAWAGTKTTLLLAHTGADSSLTMNVSVIPTTYGTLDTMVVVDDLPVILNDSSYQRAGIYVQHLTNVAGCDSILTVNLAVLYEVDSTICETDLPFTWNGVVFGTADFDPESRVARDTVSYMSSTGLDSIVAMNVHVNVTTYGSVDTAVLQNDLPWEYYGASYSIPGIYTQTITNAAGCDSVVTINLTEIYNVVAIVDSVVCAFNTPFDWNGITFTQTSTRVANLTASTGADSTLVMRVTVIYTTYGTLDTTVLENDLPFVWNGESFNTPGYHNQYLQNYAGCDSILTIHLHILYNVTISVDSTACENELPLVWNGEIFDLEDLSSINQTITHSVTMPASTGVDSTVVMTLYVNPITYGTMDTTVLENELPLSLNGSSYMTDSVFTQTFSTANANGCDSVLTVNMTVLYNVTTSLCDTVCENQLPFVWNGVRFEAEGTQDTVLTASTGVDSTVVMTLHVNPTTYGALDTVVLENALPLSLNGFSYMTDSVFTQTLSSANANGCDSVLTVNMTVLYNVSTTLRDTICENQLPFVWNGVRFDASGTQDTVLTASTGVDSIVVMTVTVNPTTYGTIDTTVFENDLPLVLNGEEYDTEGSFEQILQSVNVHSCDSVLTVNVTVLYNVTVHEDSVLCQTELPLTWNGIVFELDDETVLNAPVTLVDSTILTASIGVDSTVVMSVTIHPVTYETMNVTIIENELPFVLNGVEYDTTAVYEQTLHNANAYGCDSVITLDLTILYNVSASVDSTVCESELPLTWNDVVFELHELPVTATVVTLMNTATLTASTGVDSTVMMTLRVIPTSYGTLDTVVLENNLPLVLNGSSYLTPDTYVQTLYNANANGCDSVLTVNMTVLYNVSVEEDSTVCETELPLTWNGVTFTMHDIDGETHLAVDSAIMRASTGVDSTVVMTVYVIPTTYTNVDTIVLENNLPLHYNDSVYRESGVYTQHLVNNAGCDSVLTLNMTVLYNVTVEVDSVICDGELPFTWNGVTFAAEDIYSVTSSAMDSVVLTASTGVDSTVVMTVHVHYANTGVDVQTACDSYTWIDGVTYTASTDSAFYTLTNAAGCDSVVTLHLTVNYSVVAQDTLVLVENQLPYYITAADTTINNGAPAEFQFNYHLSTVQGCDSTIMQTVFIRYNTSAMVDTTVCASSLPYSWHGHQFTQAGSYNDTVLNADGSDHVITYQLNVSDPVVTIQSIIHITCYGDSTGGVGVLVSGGIQPYYCHWEDNAGVTVSSMAQLGNQPAGKYRLYALDVIGCMVVDSVTLQHQNDSMVAGVISSDRLVCHGSGVEGFTGTTATGGAGSVYQWQISNNGTDWTAAPTPNNAQNYTYPNLVTSSFSLRRAWVSQACGTVYSNVVTVNVAPVYNDTLRENVCQGYPYQEYGFDVTAEETAQPAVITRVRNLQSVNSCDSTVTLVLTVIPSTHTMLTDESCQRLPYQANGFDLAADELGTVGVHTFERVYTTSGCDSIVTLQLTIHPVYEIDFEDVVCEGSTYNNHGFDVTAVQTLGVSDVNMTQHLQSQNGCDSIVNLYLRVVDTSVAIVSLTADFCEEYTAELSVETNMTDYLWNTGETSQTITVNRPGTYMVTATQDNCSVTSWYTIDNCELNIYLPNAITPGNGDGLNDYFSIHDKYKPMIEDFEINIYTRWGELIYHSNDKDFKWYGVRNPHTGEILINNIYTYLIKFTDSRGIPYQITGSITVL